MGDDSTPTPMATATRTPTPTQTVTPTPTRTPQPTTTPIHLDGFVKVSRYWPPLGGINCAFDRDGKCLSRMASLLPWQNWVYKATACVPEWPFGTLVIIDGRTWICLDRGGRIVYDKGVPWVDLLTDENLPYNYGEIVPAQIVFPLNMEDQIQCEDEDWQFCYYSGSSE